MDSKQAEELLKKYWNCETSLEEEEQLREYFHTTDNVSVPDGLKESAVLFQYFGDQKKKSLSDISFDHAVSNKILGTGKKKGRVARLAYNSLRIAAGVSVVMASIWFVRSEIRKDTPQELIDTYDDPELAFEETKKALLMISRSFGTAEEQAKKINLFNEAQEEIQSDEESDKTDSIQDS